MTEIVKYSLREISTGKLLTYSTTNNSDGHCCVSESYKLNTYEDLVWEVDDLETATFVKNVSTSWYNAGYESPQHDFEPEELEIVQVTKTVNVFTARSDKYPTLREFLTWKASKRREEGNISDAKYFEYTVKEGTNPDLDEPLKDKYEYKRWLKGEL